MHVSQTTRHKISSGKKKLYRFLVVSAFFTVLLGALSIPFLFESQTLWYKVGIDKYTLRLGQVVGMSALVLLVLQVVLSVRGKILEELFTIALLMRLHRVNGVVVMLLAWAHAILVLVPEGMGNLPLGTKYWPEMIGGFLLSLLVVMVFSSHFRERFGLDYRKWRSVHRPLGYLSLGLVTAHVLFVSDSFAQNIPQLFLITLFSAVVLFVVRVKLFSRYTK